MSSALSPLAESVVSARSLLRTAAAPAAPAGPMPGVVPDGAPAPWPVPPALTSLLPDGGLRRGSTVRVEGSTSLLLALMGAASETGAWCGAVGLPSLGVLAASESGVDLDRLALVPRPRDTWPTVVAALLDAVDLVVLAPPAPARPGAHAAFARRLSTRARERRGVLIVVGTAAHWGGSSTADVELTVVGRRWDGLGAGHGHLRERSLEVRASGRRIGGRPRTTQLDLAPPKKGTAGALGSTSLPVMTRPAPA